MGVKLGDAVLYLTANNADLKKALGAAEKDVKSLGSNLAGLLGKGLILGIGAAVAAVGAIGTAAFAAGQQFDEAFDGMMMKTGATGGRLEQLKADATAVFKSIPTSIGAAADVVGSLNQRLGMTGESARILAQQLLLMGTGDAAKSTELYARVMGDWGVETQFASAKLDKLFTISQATGIGMDDLMSKVVQFGAPLRLMGFSLDESAALFGKWEKEGVNAELVMGSLRIAAGKFSTEMEGSIRVVKGGVKSLAESSVKLAKLKDALRLATMQQAEFTDKTKASSRAASESKIADLTRQIGELEAAMAKGEDRTVTVIGSQKSLRDRLQETFDAIKNNTNATAALALGMDVFGARAGPDMVAAIREGRFAIDDLTTALDDSQDAILSTAFATMDFGEKFQLMKNKIVTALAPIGAVMIDTLNQLADMAMPLIEKSLIPAIEKLALWMQNDLPWAMFLLTEKIKEGWWQITTAILIEWNKIRPKLEELRDWLKVNIPAAITVLRGEFDRLLLPVLRNVWDSLADPVTGIIPAIKILYDWLAIEIPRAFVASNSAFVSGAGSIGKFSGSLTDLVTPVQDFLDMLNDIEDFLNRILDAAQNSRVAIADFGTVITGRGGGSIFGYAGGTGFFPGGLALVGEQGPETVALPRGTRIYPHDQGPGGTTFNITINAPGGDPGAVRRAATQGVYAAWRARGN